MSKGTTTAQQLSIFDDLPAPKEAKPKGVLKSPATVKQKRVLAAPVIPEELLNIPVPRARKPKAQVTANTANTKTLKPTQPGRSASAKMNATKPKATRPLPRVAQTPATKPHRASRNAKPVIKPRTPKLPVARVPEQFQFRLGELWRMGHRYAIAYTQNAEAAAYIAKRSRRELDKHAMATYHTKAGKAIGWQLAFLHSRWDEVAAILG